MPLPTTKDVAKVMHFLKREKPRMARKQRVAIALRQTGKSRKVKSGKHPSGWF